MGAFLASSVVGLAAAAAAVCRLILGQSLVERATCIPLYLLAAAALHVLVLLHDRWLVLWRS